MCQSTLNEEAKLPKWHECRRGESDAALVKGERRGYLSPLEDMDIGFTLFLRHKLEWEKFYLSDSAPPSPSIAKLVNLKRGVKFKKPTGP